MASFSSIAELKLSVTGAKELLDVSKEMDKVTAKTRDYNKESRETAKATSAAEKEAEKFLQKLKNQADAVGKTKSEMLAMKAATLGLSDAAKPYLATISDAEKKHVSLNDTIKNLGDKISGLGGPMSDAASGTSDFLGKVTALGSSAVAVTVSLVALAGAAGIMAAFRFAGAVDDLGDLAEKLGLSATQAMVMDQQMKAAGTSLETYFSSINKVTSALAKSDDEGKAAAEALNTLGIAATDASDPFQVAAELTEKYKDKLADGNVTVGEMAALQLVMGKNYRESIIAIDNAQKAQERLNKFTEAGIGISKYGSEAASDYETATNDLGVVMSAVGSKLVAEIIPSFTSLINQFVESYKQGGLVKSAFDVIRIAAQLVMVPINLLINAFIVLDTAIGSIGKSIGAVFAAISTGSMEPLRALKGDLGSIVSDAYGKLRNPVSWDPGDSIDPSKTLQTPPGPRPSRGGRGGGGSAGSKADPYAAWMDKTRQGTSEAIQELETEEKLTSAQKDRIKFLDEIASGKLKITEMQKNEFLAANSLLQLAQQERKEQEANAAGEQKYREERRKADEARIELGKKQLEQLDAFSSKGRESIEAEERKFNQLGMTTREIQLQNDLEKINLDTKKLILDLTKDITKQEEKDAIAAEAKARANQLIADRKGLESKFAVRDGDGFGGFIQGIKNYGGAAKTTFEQMEEVGTRVAGSLEDAFTNMARTGKLSFADMARSVIANLGAIFAKMVATKLVNMIVGSFTGGLGGGAGMPDDVPTRGGRAAGGPVTAGQTMWVGEQGRELVTFGSSGSVTPNHKLSSVGSSSGGNTTHITVNVTGGSTNDETGAIVAKAIQGVIEKMPGVARAEIANQLRPGGISNPLAARAF